MPRPTVLFYVSGHGYGHARRTAEVMRALRRRLPDVSMHARTGAPEDAFAGLLAAPVNASLIDTPVFEHDVLSIDWPRTLAATAERLRQRNHLVGAEADAVRHLRPSLIVADAPFLAGDVAEALGVQCVAVTNFTWDWIYEPHAGLHPQGDWIVGTAREAYGKMRALLQLPFGHEAPAFRQVVPLPLVARRSSLDPADVLARLGLDPADGRPRVFVAMRGGVSPESVSRAATDARDFLFLTPATAPDPPRGMPANVRAVPAGDIDFSDLLAVADVVLSKLGYGTIADAIAAGSRLLWPRRAGFREDEVTEAEAPRYLRMAELPGDDFRAGRWRASLEKIMTLPAPAERMPVNGAAACAEVLAAHLMA